MDIEHKAFKTSVEASDAGEIVALVSVFGNTDLANERVMPGAFTKSLARKLPKGVWAHKWDVPIAKTLEAYETDQGLVVKGKFNLDTQAGREAFSNIKFYGVGEQDFSIGYQVVKDSIEEKSGIRELHELICHEWSPVLVGMNSETALISLKQNDPSNEPATLANQVESMLACGVQLANRFKDLRELRAKEGRVFSANNRQRISACVGSMRTVAEDLHSLLELTEPQPKAAEDAEVRAVYAEFLKTLIKK